MAKQATQISKTDRVLNFLLEGGELTAAQARSRFKVPNMRAVASNLRFKGYAVFGNEKKLSTGKQTTVYRIGKPPRRVVAAGYRALAQA
jgi:hypothetical protein